jgi:hypothetical protein
MRNIIINGGMRIAQRSAGSIGASGGSTFGAVDRMIGGIFGFTSVVSGQVSQTNNAAPVGFDSDSTCNVNMLSATNAGTGYVSITTRLEAAAVTHLAGKTATVSIKIRTSTLSTHTQTAYLRFNKPTVLDNFGSVANVADSSSIAIPANSNATKISFTRAFVAADVQNGLEISCIVPITGNITAATNFLFGDWQLEVGAVSTPLEYRPLGTELALCQRYCEVWNVTSSQVAATGQALSTTGGFVFLPYKVTKRGTVNSIVVNGPFTTLTSAGSGAGGTFALFGGDVNGARLDLSGATGLVAGNAIVLFANGAGCSLVISAEL